MNIRIEQHNPTIGDLEGNKKRILEAITAARDDGMDMLILPELATCGYPPMDLLEYDSFLNEVYSINQQLAAEVREMVVVLGTITPNKSGPGRKCYNSALVVEHGEVKAEIHKALLPTYDVFDELRYFEPARSFECVAVGKRKVGITICEDIWYNYSDPQYLTYDINPAQELVGQGAEMILNLSASPYTRNKPAGRERMLRRHAEEFEIPLLYANQVGGNTETIADGDSLAMNRKGEVVARAGMFKEDAVAVSWKGSELAALDEKKGITGVPSLEEQLFSGLVLGLRDYLRKTGVADKVLLGLSGGIDSALVACIAAEALGADRVVGITMPSEFSSEGSVRDSEILAHNLGIEFQALPIRKIYEVFDEALAPFFEGTPFGVAEENLQPRIRGTLLMAYSNKFGHMLLNTGNKSELATGYCTLYGDMAGGLSVIGDLYKTEVYEVAHWLNNDYYKNEIIPQSILSKPPSAELRPDQKDSDSLPEYDVLDTILKAYLEEQSSVKEIVEYGYDQQTVSRILNLVDQMEYKRAQAAPVLKVSSKAFGSGRRWPMVQRWTQNRSANKI
ncbi:NAD+ synthase [Fodinibius sediminis]|uniref:Glutamine-dependent NAD(+) synthetase n=1 Tax=Fodinibius sediminis TaxID=1214077 RepID=A0A521E0D8_9BACT|nr:NAD+ synthase [Fodinibius sediminis]SMO77439.1 NH(3)-dependent NAD(+) synthetase [Fodinibius sediminis]